MNDIDFRNVEGVIHTLQFILNNQPNVGDLERQSIQLAVMHLKTACAVSKVENKLDTVSKEVA